MTFREYIRLSDELYEQAFKRDEIFREAENKRAQIYYHLLKVLFYNDPYNNLKHCKDIGVWILSIQRMKSKSSWLSKDVFFSVLYSGYEEDFNYTEEKDILDVKYQELALSGLSPKEIKSRLDSIYDKICKELSTKSFKTIRKYKDIQNRFKRRNYENKRKIAF